MQDEITMKILDAVQVKLTAGEDALLHVKGTKNLDAYLKLMQALQCAQVINKENIALARRLTEQAIVLDTRYAVAYATLCKIQVMETNLGVHKNARQALEEASMICEKAITLDASNAVAHGFLGITYVYLRRYDEAISEVEKAVSLDPNSAQAYDELGSVLDWAGRPQEAVPFFKKCLRLSPIPIYPSTLYRLGMVYFHLGQYDEAVNNCKRALQLYGPDHLFAHLVLAAVYASTGHEKEMHAEAAEVLRIDPTFSEESYARRLPYKDQKATDNWVSAMRRAELK